jgi:hypothetical protein
MTDQVNNSNYTEAPASWTVRYSVNGYDCMLTLRGESGNELLPRAQAALRWLTESGAQPVAKPTNGNDGKAQDHPALKVCKYHNAEMKRHEKDGQVWYSHKLADGTYCKGQEASK